MPTKNEDLMMQRDAIARAKLGKLYTPKQEAEFQAEISRVNAANKQREEDALRKPGGYDGISLQGYQPRPAVPAGGGRHIVKRPPAP